MITIDNLKELEKVLSNKITLLMLENGSVIFVMVKGRILIQMAQFIKVCEKMIKFVEKVS